VIVPATVGVAVTLATLLALKPLPTDGVAVQAKFIKEGSDPVAASNPTDPPGIQKVVAPEGVIAKVGAAVTVTTTSVRGPSHPAAEVSATQNEVEPGTEVGYEPVEFNEVPPVATLYQFNVPPVPVAVKVTAPGPQRLTGAAVGAAGNAKVFTVTVP
jgi:type IV secretory pathway VirB10-like protein